jgi:hypothetical protein
MVVLLWNIVAENRHRELYTICSKMERQDSRGEGVDRGYFER